MNDDKQNKLPDQEEDDLDDIGELSDEDIDIYENDDIKRILLEDPQGFYRALEKVVIDSTDSLAPLLQRAPRRTEKQRKIRINRRYRMCFGDRRLPYPEVDNLYEKIRGKISHKIKMRDSRRREKKRQKMK